MYLASDAGSSGTDDYAFAMSAPELFTVAAESATDDRREKLMRAKSMIYAGEHADAAGLLVELLQSKELPEAHTALLELGVLLRRGDFPGTLGVLRAIANRPGVLRATAMKMLADRDASRGQRADALAMLDSIQRQFPNTPDAFCAQLSVFYLYFETSLFEEAAKALSSVVPQNELEGLSVAAAHQLLSLEWDDVAASDAPVAFLSGDVGANAGDEMTLTLTNYPNPFNPVTSIQYQLPEESHVTLTVYDLMGRQVRLLVDDRQEAGSHRAVFDAEHLPSGAYLYRLQATGQTKTGSMLLLK